MSEPTVKQLLGQIQADQKANARKMYDLASEFSVYKNEQEDINKKNEKFQLRVLHILDNDESTNTKGLVENVRNINNRVSDIEIKEKVTWAKIGGGAAVVFFILSILAKVSNFFK